MSLNSLGLGFVFTARDLASRTVTRLERNFDSLDRRVGLVGPRLDTAFRGIGVGLAVMGAGAVAIGGAFALAHASGEFEQSIAAVGGVANATAAELTLLRNAALDTGLATQFTPTEAAMGLRELAQQGFNARQSMELLLPALDLAGGSLGELSPQEAAGLAAQAIHAFGIETRDASMAVDQMLFSANAFAIGAGELPLAMGIVSRGAQTLSQSLPESLVAWGLVKNIIPTVERSSTAVSTAMERMATPRTQRMLEGIGIAVADAEGNFRPFLDVIGELAPRLEQMTERERGDFLIRTFGARALGGINAIVTQVTNGIETAEGQIVRGADAIAYLRGQFAGAEGTAAGFRDRMLDTFAGQEQLLRGVVQTLVVVMGAPFAQALRPFVEGTRAALQGFLEAFRALSAPVQRAFAVMVLAGGAFATLVGGAVAGGIAIALFATVIDVVAAAVGTLLALLAPAVVLVGVLGVAVGGFVIAIRRNVGGIADLFDNARQRISLAIRALSQLFEQGGFSGAVLEELDRAENQGVRRFVIAIFRLGYRLGRVWEGIKEGFTSAIDAMAPTFRELRTVLGQLGGELQGLFDSLTGGANDLPSSEYRSFGRTIGSTVATLVRWLAEGLVAGVRFATGLVRGVRSIGRFVAPAFGLLLDAFGRLGRAWSRLTGSADEGGVRWQTVGRVLAEYFGTALVVAVAGLSAVIDMIALWMNALGLLRQALSSVWGAIRGSAQATAGVLLAIGQRVMAFFDAMAAGVRRAFASVVDSVVQLLRRVPGGLLPESLQRIARMPLSTEVPSGNDLSAVQPIGAAPTRRGNGAARPAVAEASHRGGLLEQVEAQLAPLFGLRGAEERAPITVQLQVDGQTLAEATHRAGRETAARSFTPVPTFG